MSGLQQDEDARSPVARDVARLAGVSTSTVSRVFNGTASVRPDKREAVIRAARELGFVANGAARALSMRRFMAVGAVIPNIENEVFIRALSAFQEGLRRAGYTLLLSHAGYDLDDEQREAGFLLDRGIDGLMLVGDIHRPALLDRVDRQRIPLVQTFSLSRERACVGFDNRAAGARAAGYLLDLGHRRIGAVTGTRRDNDRGGARLQGIMDALAARGLALHPAHDVEVHAYGIAAGRDALRQMLASDEAPPTAIICGTDQIAFGAMIEARGRGMVLPRDLSVIGFNDADYAPFLEPSLTTLRIHPAEIGRAAAEHLVARMSGRPAVRLTEIDAELILRGSTGPPGKVGCPA
ncbi:LacI family DNA-binding transcriptional regulator [Pararoseomonas indoligenes]|uniref:LacI family DNA-binding transcriptional regulator n=1 Tax=Roseomonas indoligenes TaxID=2820811 RepID=A0A940N2D3_9PROT|nr:LacI family DNA-binding transcriptional regulator [Pararoseomonas indoligenes]MBP0495482.1 LacI family DNA-binding transcriptional regulator [Pararoseomonas indoligenes]